ncbi:hypothetical protein FK268_22480 [Tsukamurella sputi]|uniref:Uncharacterized protein n=1 Tax=Tsukamurella sputi TaxID=2591848 RepID=A0A5C5RG79_9ACTN|nr:hypothetical protein [Tsukamurella sputi]TWS21810.1 hypothetical protein FK268_22480 [Tsukamurella sputi]
MHISDDDFDQAARLVLHRAKRRTSKPTTTSDLIDALIERDREQVLTRLDIAELDDCIAWTAESDPEITVADLLNRLSSRHAPNAYIDNGGEWRCIVHSESSGGTVRLWPAIDSPTTNPLDLEPTATVRVLWRLGQNPEFPPSKTGTDVAEATSDVTVDAAIALTTQRSAELNRRLK